MNTRKLQFWILIFLSAGTAFCQYILQGTFAAGMNPIGFDQRFWTADQVLWGLRALIETWVVGYLFSTTARKWYQQFPLVFFEIILLALIVFTLGPAFEALGTQQMVYEILGGGFRGWAYAIAAYTSLMIAGAGTAYRIQPFDLKEELVIKTTKLTRGQAIPILLEAIQRTGTVDQGEFARDAGVRQRTVSNWLQHMEDRQIILSSGNGNFKVIEEEMEIPEFG